MNGFSFVHVAVEEVLNDPGIVRPAGLVFSEMAEARGVFPGAHGLHRFHVVGEFLVRIGKPRL